MKWCKIEYMNKVILCGGSCYLASLEWKKETDMTVSLDWENLGFSYMKLPYRYLAHYRNGAWEKGELTEDATLHLSESSPSLHYGQQAFEG